MSGLTLAASTKQAVLSESHFLSSIPSILSVVNVRDIWSKAQLMVEYM